MGWTLGLLAVGFGDVWFQKITKPQNIGESVPVIFIGQAIAGALLLALTNINPKLGIGMTLLATLGLLFHYGL